MAIELGEREIVTRRRVPVRTRLEWLMRERGLNMPEVAYATGMGKEEVQRMMAGRRVVPRQRLNALCLALNTHPGFILEWTDDPRIPRGWENPLSSSSAERNGCSSHFDPDLLLPFYAQTG